MLKNKRKTNLRDLNSLTQKDFLANNCLDIIIRDLET
jgi:hypothetical protein